MKPINEIRIRLTGIIWAILVPLCKELYPSGSGWFGLCMFILTCMIGIYVSYFITEILIAFKKWWNE